jgi:hypothetical protein
MNMYLIYSNGERDDIGSFEVDGRRLIFKAKCDAYAKYGTNVTRRLSHRERCPVAVTMSHLEFYGINDLTRHMHHCPHDTPTTPILLEGLPVIITHFE